MTEPETPNYFGNDATDRLPVDRDELRAEVQDKYAAVALDPTGAFHFHTGRPNAEHCRYDMQQVDSLLDWGEFERVGHAGKRFDGGVGK
ncbi:MAG: hypothetical protein AAFY28_04975, partial [Actinomycetota bacterium]